MQLATVNVIESADGNVISLRSFPDDKIGNRHAETVFEQLVKEYEGETGIQWEDEQIQQMLEDGHYSNGNGYDLALVHSCLGPVVNG